LNASFPKLFASPKVVIVGTVVAEKMASLMPKNEIG